MDTSIKFNTFLDKLKNGQNAPLVEGIKKAHALVEGMGDTYVMYLPDGYLDIRWVNGERIVDPDNLPESGEATITSHVWADNMDAHIARYAETADPAIVPLYTAYLDRRSKRGTPTATLPLKWMKDNNIFTDIRTQASQDAFEDMMSH